jgi:hypothetical protein
MSIFSIGRTPVGPLNVEGDGIYDTVSVLLTVGDFQGISTNNQFISTITVSDGAPLDYSDETRAFIYSLTTKTNSVSSSWFSLNSTTLFNKAFQTDADYESGSSLNKFRLTGLSIVASTYGTTVGAPQSINLTRFNDSEVSYSPLNFTTATTSTASADLNNNKVTLSQTYSFSDNIRRFRIIPSSLIYVESILFTYSIDYSICPII